MTGEMDDLGPIVAWRALDEGTPVYDPDGKVLFDSRTAPVPSFPQVEWLGPQAPHAVENLGDDPGALFVWATRSRRTAGTGWT